MREEDEYYPDKLAETAKMILKSHKKSAKYDYSNPNDDLIRLVKTISTLSQDKIESFAFTLSDREICFLAMFLARNIDGNSYWVEDENIYLILDFVLSENVCEAMFYGWQNSYDNLKFNNFFEDICHTDIFKSVLHNCHLSSSDLSAVILSEVPQISLGRFCVDNRSAADSKEIEDILDYYGIQPGSKIFKDCLSFFYVYCDKSDYLEIPLSELIQIVKSYTKEMVSAFLKNFLSRFTLSELVDKFLPLAMLLSQRVPDVDSENFNDYFMLFAPEQKEKYRNWINSAKIQQIFGNNVRSQFWKKYLFKSVRKHRNTDSSELRFENHVIVEFLGDDEQGLEKNDFGPMYLYDADVFDENIRYHIDFSDNLRKFLFARKDLYIRRITHNGNWQYEFDAMLMRYHVTKKILD